jgi:hypothetical protein
MKNFSVGFVLLFGLLVCGSSGCGSGGTNTVVEPAPTGAALTPEAQQSYEAAMKAQRTGPGN